MTGSGAPFARLVDGLVAGARADRDGVFNTLDAINRQTRAVSDRLAGQVEEFLVAAEQKRARQAVTAGERDARFDPEDEWELPATAEQLADAQPQRGAASSRSTDDDDDLPETWLR
jgi:hypothetical protein